MPEGEHADQPRRPAPPVRTVRAAIVVGAFVVALLLLLGPASDLTATPPPTTHPTAPPPPVVRSKTTVQVVNGTVASGVGGSFQQQLNREGWDALSAENLKVHVTTANEQHVTYVYFLPHEQAAAQDVAADLGIPADHVVLRTRSVLNEVEGAYRDAVVVVLGTDQVH